MTRADRRRLAAVFFAAVLVVGACGRDKTTPEAEEEDGAEATTTTAVGEAAGAFGDLGAICGPAPEGETLGATDVGVTADTISIGTISDPGYSGRPGLNQELFDTAEGFTEWCNAAGGINGRRIDLRERDAALTEHQARMIEACEEGDFVLVGGGGVFDGQGQKERLACGLPQVPGYVVSAEAIGSDLTIQPVPNPVEAVGLGDLLWLGEQFPEARQKLGLVVLSVPATIAIAERWRGALEGLGWEIVYQEQYNPAGEVSWRGFAEGLKAAGARGVIWWGEPVNLAAIRRAMDEVEYHPDFVRVDANHYDDLLLSEGGEAVDGTYIRGIFHPFLDEDLAGQNAATSQYLDLMAEYEPDGKVAYLGVMGFSAWLLWATAARDCGAELTRDCVWDRLGEVTDWTGGGLHAPQNPGGRTVSDCFVMFEARGGEFVLPDIDPDQDIYRCDPEGTVVVEVEDVGVHCENPAFADDPQPSTCPPV